MRAAAARGAQVILLQELFEAPYFCQLQRADFFTLASPADVRLRGSVSSVSSFCRQSAHRLPSLAFLTRQVVTNPLLRRFSALAAELQVVLPISFFERAHQAHYNTVMMIDADGTNLGLYRKSHIPDGPGYQEKFYFNPGDTGFKVWKTRYCNVGVGICWDQWFPECARAMVLQGAELLLYPTAIGTEPQDQSLDSSRHWQRVMQGHAGANLTPLVASNRIGREKDMIFYGLSFIADHTGAVVAEASNDKEEVLVHTFDLEAVRQVRLFACNEL